MQIVSLCHCVVISLLSYLSYFKCNALHFALCYRHVCVCVCVYAAFVDLRKTV